MTRLFWAFPLPPSAQQSTFDPDTGTCGPCRDVLWLVRRARFLSARTCPDAGLQQPERRSQAPLASFLANAFALFSWGGGVCLANAASPRV